MKNILKSLEKEIKARIADASPQNSYVAKLHHQGVDSILKKVSEESAEFVLAVKNKNSVEITHEGADLCFHFLLALSHSGVDLGSIEDELGKRFGKSGIDEKNSRQKI